MDKVEKKEGKKKPPKTTPTLAPQPIEVPSEPSEAEKITQLEKEIAELKKWKEDNLRQLANQFNQLKSLEERKKTEIKEIERYGKQKLLAKIVDFLVNLESGAVKAMRDYPDPQGIVLSHAEGIEITLDNLKKDLENEGLREIPIQVGKDLQNGLWHEAVGQIKSEKPARTILEVVKKGYLLHERVLRVAEVKIAKNS